MELWQNFMHWLHGPHVNPDMARAVGQINVWVHCWRWRLPWAGPAACACMPWCSYSACWTRLASLQRQVARVCWRIRWCCGQ
jgi:hypothetical protein